MKSTAVTIDVASIENAIQMLNKYTKEPDIKPLISTLDALKKDLHNESLLAQLADIWRNLGA